MLYLCRTKSIRMINRLVIRTRVFQLAYAHLHKGEQKIATAEAELRKALSRSYDLYLYLLRLPIDITERFAELQQVRSRKHLASYEDLNPNYKLQDNRYVSALRESETLEAWYNQFALSWAEEDLLLRHLVDKIEASERYQEYLKEDATFESDRNFWVQTFTQLIATDEQLGEYLEEQSIYWDDALCYIEKVQCEERPGLDAEDITQALSEAKETEGAYQSLRYEDSCVEIVKNFVQKSMKRALEGENIDHVLLPEYKDEDDETFATQLLRQTLVGYDKTSEIIKKHLSSGWDKERLADVDDLLMHMAVTEFLYFPAIPTSISINEYVELSKHYSTSKSSAFINGVLDAVAKELKAEGKILKK